MISHSEMMSFITVTIGLFPALKAVDDMIEKNKVPRAIICANDMMAIAARAEFQRRGYKIPEDIIINRL